MLKDSREIEELLLVVTVLTWKIINIKFSHTPHIVSYIRLWEIEFHCLSHSFPITTFSCHQLFCIAHTLFLYLYTCVDHEIKLWVKNKSYENIFYYSQEILSVNLNYFIKHITFSYLLSFHSLYFFICTLSSSLNSFKRHKFFMKLSILRTTVLCNAFASFYLKNFHPLL